MLEIQQDSQNPQGRPRPLVFEGAPPRLSLDTSLDAPAGFSRRLPRRGDFGTFSKKNRFFFKRNCAYFLEFIGKFFNRNAIKVISDLFIDQLTILRTLCHPNFCRPLSTRYFRILSAPLERPAQRNFGMLPGPTQAKGYPAPRKIANFNAQ